MPPIDPPGSSAPAPAPAPAASGAGSAVAEPTIADVLGRLDALTQDVNGRFTKMGQDLGRVRVKVREEGTEGGAPSAPDAKPSGGLSRSELDAALRLGELKAKLPQPAADRVQKMIEDGSSYDQALTLAQVISESLSTLEGVTPSSAGPGVTPRSAPTGTSATPAHRSAHGHPGSIEELVELSRTNKDRYKAVMADPDFDPTTIPQRRRR